MSERHVHFARDTQVPLERGLFVVGEQCRNREAEIRCDLVNADGLSVTGIWHRYVYFVKRAKSAIF